MASSFIITFGGYLDLFFCSLLHYTPCFDFVWKW